MTWIGTQDWSDSPSISETSPAVLAGMLGVRTYSVMSDELTDVVKNFTRHVSDTLCDNPLLTSLLRSDDDAAASCGYGDEGVENATLDSANLMMAIYAVAHALDAAVRQGDMCAPLGPYLRAVNVTLFENLYFTFDEQGDLVQTRYDIVNMQLNETAGGEAVHRKVGEWRSDAEQNLVINESLIVWKKGFRVLPSPSVCCWDCMSCEDGHYSETNQSTMCEVCGPHRHTERARTKCVANTEIWLSWTDRQGILLLLLAALGETYALATVVIMTYFRQHPVIEFKSNLKISFLLTVIVGLVAIVPFRARPSDASCNTRTILLMCVSNLLAANLLARTPVIRTGIKSLKRRYSCLSHYADNVCQTALVLLVAGVGIAYCSWLVLAYPMSIHRIDVNQLWEDTPDTDQTIVSCTWLPRKWWNIVFAYVYPCTIAIITVVLCQFTPCTRHRLERSTTDPRYSVDEAKLISYTCYIAFLVVATLTSLSFALGADVYSFISKLTMALVLYTALGFFTLPRFYKIYRASAKRARGDSIVQPRAPLTLTVSYHNQTSAINYGMSYADGVTDNDVSGDSEGKSSERRESDVIAKTVASAIHYDVSADLQRVRSSSDRRESDVIAKTAADGSRHVDVARTFIEVPDGDETADVTDNIIDESDSAHTGFKGGDVTDTVLKENDIPNNDFSASDVTSKNLPKT
ncbi:PREDICTED: extracellular calcium-sensing receptor-like [Priapulus caudatus]|uniref:Extracellular calcium-sensing receptor-like n=1 Tax=Priapulus caudatus TaxID=37621 RepID=A0ABM1F6Z1_PRICU|nr:PREDICTED: extracellular calcium-sensing receptor-like [Priapulus caudatus]